MQPPGSTIAVRFEESLALVVRRVNFKQMTSKREADFPIADHPPGTPKTESIQVHWYINLYADDNPRGPVLPFTTVSTFPYSRLPRLNVRVSPEKIGGVVFALEGD
jgi:hypothetical protein